MSNFIKNLIEQTAQLFCQRTLPDRENLVETSGPLQLFQDDRRTALYMVKDRIVHKVFELSNDVGQLARDAYNKFDQSLAEVTRHYPQVTVEQLKLMADMLLSNLTYTPTHLAVYANITGVYLAEGVRGGINTVVDGVSPVQLAIQKGYSRVLKELIQAGASVLHTDASLDNVLHLCVRIRDDSFVCAALQHAPAEEISRAINALNAKGETPLHQVAISNSEAKCKVLLEFGADPVAMGKIATPVHYACKHKATKVLKLFLEKNPDAVNAVCEKHNSVPLHWCRRVDEAQLLYDNDPVTSLEHVNRRGNRPVNVAATKGNLDMVIFCVINRCDVNAQGENGDTPLHAAAYGNHEHIIKFLLCFEADTKIKNHRVATPYEIVVGRGKIKDVLVLEKLQESSTSCGVGHCNSKIDVSSIDKSKVQLPTLLSLDGGGVKGMVIAQILMVIEQKTGKKICELFDWIVGTSVGGIFAMCYCRGKPAIETLRACFHLKEQVFFGAKPYSNDNFNRFLKKQFDGEGETMRTLPSNPKCVVTAVLADRIPAKLHMFKNYDLGTPVHYNDNRRFSTQVWDNSVGTATQEQMASRHELNPDVPLWKIARYTGTIPHYATPIDDYIDGGIIANNPTLDGLQEMSNHRNQKLRCPSTSLKVPGQQPTGSKTHISHSRNVGTVGIVVSVGTGKNPTKTLEGGLEIKRSALPSDLMNNAYAGINLHQILIQSVTEPNSHQVQRAKAWCDSLDAYFFRLNPSLKQKIVPDEGNNVILTDLLWSTHLYIMKNMDTFDDIVALLTHPSRQNKQL